MIILCVNGRKIYDTRFDINGCIYSSSMRVIYYTPMYTHSEQCAKYFETIAIRNRDDPNCIQRGRMKCRNLITLFYTLFKQAIIFYQYLIQMLPIRNFIPFYFEDSITTRSIDRLSNNIKY